VQKFLKEEKEEVTYYLFLSQLKEFLRLLLSKPISCELPQFFRDRGYTKGKMIEYLVKSGIVERTEKINTEIPEDVQLEVSYVVPKKDFERKVKIMYIKLFDK